MFVPRVTLPSQAGPVTVILDCAKEFKNLGYCACPHVDCEKDDKNRNNFVLLRTCWVSLLADSPFDTAKPVSVIRRFCRDLFDIRGTIALFSTLGDAVCKSEQIKEDGSVIRNFIPAMTRTPIFREYHHWWRTGDPHALRYVLGFLKYGKKVSCVDESLHTTAFRKWQETEDRLRNLELPTFVENLRLVCRWLFSDFSLGTIYPSHGGGAVAERDIRGVQAKNALLTLSPKVWNTYFVDSIFNCTETGDFGLPDFEGTCTVDWDQTARLMFVPKDYKTSRSISMEPIGFQFAQQGVLWYFEHYLSRSKVSSFVDLDRQEANQEAAQYGSFTGQVDTIDLSSASDSVAWKLVQRIMPSNLLRHLHATRSTHVSFRRDFLVPYCKPQGDDIVISPLKFAPMGSALCFPTQCCIFVATVITVGLIQSLGRDWKDPTALVGVDLDNLMQYSFGKFGKTSAGRFQPPQVYGDDICLDHRLLFNVMDALTAMGFTVNREKSFFGQDTFRESCGKYYSRGHDVSFILHSVKPLDEDRVNVETLGSVIDLANRAREMGYLRLRSTLINFALRHKFPRVAQTRAGINPILFTENSDDSFAILTRSSDIRNTHLRRRNYDASDPPLRRAQTAQMFQRDEVQSITTVPCGKVLWEDQYENYSYTAWWRSQRGKRDQLRFSQSLSRADRLYTTAAFRWTGR